VPYASADTIPPADYLAQSPQRMVASGGRIMPRWLSEDGVYWSVQTHMGRNSFAWVVPNSSLTTLIQVGGLQLTTSGTLTARQVAATNRLTRARRVAYVSAATAGSYGGWYSSATGLGYLMGSGSNANGGGFAIYIRWGCSDAATVAGANMFLGMGTNNAAPVVTANPNTFTNCFGIAQLAGGANLNIVYGGSAAQTSIDLGANFPAAGLSTDYYEAYFYNSPLWNNQIAYRVERIGPGNVASGLLTAATPGTQLPLNTAVLVPRMYRANNATALAVGLDIAGFFAEADF
jgi:hypothetical protein